MTVCRAAAIGLLAAGALLGGCGTAAGPATVKVPLPITYVQSVRKVKRVPTAVGWLLPHVAGYGCGGFYQPANPRKWKPGDEGAPFGFWQLQLFCTDPHLRLHAPKGGVAAGVVLVWEMPGDAKTPLGKASGQAGLTDLHMVRLDGEPVGEGRIDLGGYESDIVWLREGRTSYVGLGRSYTRPVLVEMYGRDVPYAVLLRFARSLKAVGTQE